MAIQRIQEFLTAIQSAKNENDLQAICYSELAYLRQAYSVNDYPNDNGVYSGLATYKRAITDYRKALFQVDKNHPGREFFKLSNEDSSNMRYQNGKSSMLNYKNRMNGNIFTIENPFNYVKTSIQLLNANSYIDNILGLAALTGRRVNEIGYSCEFDYCNYDDVYNVYHQFEDIIDLESLDMLMVFGLSKKQTYLNDKSTKDTGIIPVLCDKEIILMAVNELRKTKTFIDSTDFHNKASKDLSKKVKKHYGEFIGEKCTSHDLRKAYARLTYDLMVNEDVKNDDGLHIFAEFALQQKIPDNYMKFSSSK